MYNIIVSLLVFVFILYYFLISVKKYPKIRLILTVALLVRLLVLILYQYFGESDPDGYIARASSIYNDYSGIDFLKNIQVNAYFYSWLIAGIWKIIGINLFAIGLINAFVSYYTCVKAYDLAKKIGGEKYASKVLWVAAFFPMLIRFSVATASREVYFTLFLVLFLVKVYDYYTNKRLRDLLIALFFCILMAIIHTVGLVFLVLPVLLFVIPNLKKRKKIIGAIIMATLIAVGLVFLVRNNIGTSKLNIGADRYSSWEQVNFIQKSSASGRAQYLGDFHANNLLQYILYLPIRVVYFLFAPFPWMITSGVDLLGVLDSLLYLFLILFMILRIRRSRMPHFIKCLGFTLVAFVVVMASATSNYGTAMRHRQKIIIPLAMVAYSSYVLNKEKDVKEDSNEK